MNKKYVRSDLLNDLLHSLQFLLDVHVLGQPHVSGQGNVLTDGQLLVERHSKLQDIPHLLTVPVLDILQLHPIDKHTPLKRMSKVCLKSLTKV